MDLPGIEADLNAYGCAAPRRQSRAEVVPLAQPDAVIFPVHHHQVRAARRVYRAAMRKGVNRVRSGSRHRLDIIFRDAL
jgi:hypothetical protein